MKKFWLHQTPGINRKISLSTSQKKKKHTVVLVRVKERGVSPDDSGRVNSDVPTKCATTEDSCYSGTRFRPINKKISSSREELIGRKSSYIGRRRTPSKREGKREQRS